LIFLAAYGAAKHAINGMTQIAALEYIPAKIRCVFLKEI